MEKDLYAPFSRFIAKNWGDKGSAVFELKRTHKNRFNKNLVEDHQIRALKMAKNGGVYHKISDQSQGAKPFDSFIIKGCEAWLVICFDRNAYFIDIDIWCDCAHDQVSFTEEECKSICSIQTVL